MVNRSINHKTRSPYDLDNFYELVQRLRFSCSFDIFISYRKSNHME